MKRLLPFLAFFVIWSAFLMWPDMPSVATGAPRQGNTNAQGVFLAFHLEVSDTPRIARLWSSLVAFVELADRYGAKVSLQFSEPWARYVFENNLTSTVLAWEANGHEIALHHHGPTHKFFDGYTDRPDLIRTDGWYATPGVYKGDMAALMAYLDPLAANPIVSAGMSDAATDWPEGVLYYATKAGEDNAKSDLVSVPWQTTYNGSTVTVVTNAGYAIDHLGDAAVTLTDIENALQTATADQILGIVINDMTIESHFDQIEPLFQLLERYHIQARTTRDVVSTYRSTATATPTPASQPFPSIADAT